MWFDSHCHLDFSEFDADRTAVWARAQRAGVGQVFIPGVTPRQWSRLPSLKSRYGFPFGVGHHPAYLHRLTAKELDESLALLSHTATRLDASAIGEVGLDRRVAESGKASMDLQRKCLVAHILAARQSRLPLVLHVVRAHGAALEILESHAPLTFGGVLHSYSGSADLVLRYARLGLVFSFSGAVTRPSAKRATAAIQAVPDEALLLETDAPDQLPTGFSSCTEEAAPPATLERHGVRNEPAALVVIAEHVARIRGTTSKQVLALASENARRLFGGANPEDSGPVRAR